MARPTGVQHDSILSFRAPFALAVAVDRAAREDLTSTSTLIRQALAAYLAARQARMEKSNG